MSDWFTIDHIDVDSLSEEIYAFMIKIIKMLS